MVNCEIGSAWFRRAILAGILVAGQDGATRKGQRKVTRDADIVYQADDEGDRQRQLLGAQPCFSRLHDLGLLFEEEYHGTAHGDDI
jgi:hypothetical protein